jgi:prepilin-type N-terminal cleavage/methylation domain-containing protein
MKLPTALNHNFQKQQAFTLIELILSVVIIVILTGSVIRVIDPRAIRAKARDSQRESDVRIIQASLETYFSDHRAYPSTSGSWVDFSTLGGTNHPLQGYINEVPIDPEGGAYMYNSDGGTYSLVAEMEVDTSANGRCYGSGLSSCYGVTSP